MAEKQTFTETIVTGPITTTYYGESSLGNRITDPRWRITKTVADNTNPALKTVIKRFPIQLNGPERKRGYPSDGYEFAWSDRASLHYSLFRDSTAPTLLSVHVASNNADPAVAVAGDTLTFTVVASERLGTLTATVFGKSPNMVSTVDGVTWTFAYMVESGDALTSAPFTINFSDVSAFVGIPVTSTTDGSSVTVMSNVVHYEGDFSLNIPGDNYGITLAPGVSFTTPFGCPDIATLLSLFDTSITPMLGIPTTGDWAYVGGKLISPSFVRPSGPFPETIGCGAYEHGAFADNFPLTLV